DCEVNISRFPHAPSRTFCRTRSCLGDRLTQVSLLGDDYHCKGKSEGNHHASAQNWLALITWRLRLFRGLGGCLSGGLSFRRGPGRLLSLSFGLDSHFAPLLQVSGSSP